MMSDAGRDLAELTKALANAKREDLDETALQSCVSGIAERIRVFDPALRKHLHGLPDWLVQDSFALAWADAPAKKAVERQKFLKDIADNVAPRDNLGQEMALLSVLFARALPDAIFFLFQLDKKLRARGKGDPAGNGKLNANRRDRLLKFMSENNNASLKAISEWQATTDEEKYWLKTVAPLLFETLFAERKNHRNQDPEILCNFLEWLFSSDLLNDCIEKFSDGPFSVVRSWPEEFQKRARELDERLAKSEKGACAPVQAENSASGDANRERNAAECHKTTVIQQKPDLSDHNQLEKRLGALENRVAILEKRVAAPEDELLKNKLELKNRIEELEKLRLQYTELQKRYDSQAANGARREEQIEKLKENIKEKIEKMDEQGQKISEIETILADQNKYLAELKNEILLKDEKIASMEAQHRQEKENTRSRIDGLVANERNTFLEKIGSKLKAEYANSQRLAEDDPARVILDNIFQELKNIGVKF